jgi:hypothetical protein
MATSKPKHNRLVTQCPVCSGRLHVTHLKCGECATELSGEFAPNEFARLAPDKLDFLRTFLTCRGNLKEVEGALGISYPTVRARLDNVLAALGFGGGGESAGPSEADKEQVLEALERGELTLDEAERRLRGED